MLVIDASVAVKWVVLEAGSEQALGLIDANQELIAPDWMLLEAAHGIWKAVGAGALTSETAIRANDAMPNFFAQLVPAVDLMKAAVDLSYALFHPTYVCLYLALAIREQVSLVTADRKFWNAAKRANMDQHLQLLTWSGQIA